MAPMKSPEVYTELKGNDLIITAEFDIPGNSSNIINFMFRRTHTLIGFTDAYDYEEVALVISNLFEQIRVDIAHYKLSGDI